MTEWLEEKGLGKAVKASPDQLPKKRASEDNEAPDLSKVALPTVRPDGVWSLTVQTPIGKQVVKLTARSEGNKMSGDLDGGEGRNEITEGTIDGASVFWKATMKKPVKVKISYKAKIEGDTMTGTAKTPLLPTINFSGTRVVAAPPPPTES